jgi:hypothetical protein
MDYVWDEDCVQKGKQADEDVVAILLPGHQPYINGKTSGHPDANQYQECNKLPLAHDAPLNMSMVRVSRSGSDIRSTNCEGAQSHVVLGLAHPNRRRQ